MSSREELEAADGYCRFLANRHYENFSVVSHALPARTRLHLARIYAFCRLTDDLGDESAGYPGTQPAGGLARLRSWREQTAACLERGEEAVHPVLLALSRTVRECDLRPTPFLELIEANVQDQTVSEYATWDDLLGYCRYSAAPVGRMVLGVFGVLDSRAEQLSDDVCIGLQLANFAQDVSVDRGKGRTYLVQADIREVGVEGAVQRMCDRADSLLASGVELEEMVPFRLRVQLALYRLGGGAIVAAVRSLGYHTDKTRPSLSALTKASLIPRAVQQSTRRRREHVQAHRVA